MRTRDADLETRSRAAIQAAGTIEDRHEIDRAVSCNVLVHDMGA